MTKREELQKLTVEIATRLFGCNVEYRTPPRYGTNYYHCACQREIHGCPDPNDDVLKDYAESIEFGWDVVTEMANRGYDVDIKFVAEKSLTYTPRGWHCTFGKWADPLNIFSNRTCSAQSDSPAESICRAAVLVLDAIDKQSIQVAQ